MDKLNNSIEICLEDLTYVDEPLEVRVVVLSHIFKELNIPYRRYYTKKSQRSFKRVKKPDIISDKDLTITFTINTDKYYFEYALWMYEKRMEAISQFYKMYFL